ncbi:MAG: nucleotidyltransferase domain-containing protein [Rhodocyclaceae bacterium]
MLNPAAIQEAARRIAAAASAPVRVILFGSYARGDAREDSDLDLVVVEKQVVDHTREYLRLRDAVGCIGTSVDLLLLSESEYEKKKQWWTTPLYWADREGMVLYESA